MKESLFYQEIRRRVFNYSAKQVTSRKELKRNVYDYIGITYLNEITVKIKKRTGKAYLLL